MHMFAEAREREPRETAMSPQMNALSSDIMISEAKYNANDVFFVDKV